MLEGRFKTSSTSDPDPGCWGRGRLVVVVITFSSEQQTFVGSAGCNNLASHWYAGDCQH